jgi:hypothetical protein
MRGLYPAPAMVVYSRLDDRHPKLQMSDVQEPSAKEPPERSHDWVLKSANRVLLGQFSIPGWLGFLFAIFWGVPGWQSKFDFWARVAQSSNGWLTRTA